MEDNIYRATCNAGDASFSDIYPTNHISVFSIYHFYFLLFFPSISLPQMDPTTTSSTDIKKSKQSVKKKSSSDGQLEGGVIVHSQVIRIKQEIEKLKEPSHEIRRLLLRDIKRHRSRSRSPLGISERAILVGNT